MSAPWVPSLRGYMNGGWVDQPLDIRPEDQIAGTAEDGAPIAGPPLAAVLRAWAMLSQAAPPETVWQVRGSP